MHSFPDTTRFYFLGCGNMGRAILHAWVENGLAVKRISISVATEASAQKLREEGFDAAPHKPYAGEEWVVLAVKPQMLDALLPALAGQLSKTTVITLAAGKDFRFYRQFLPAQVPFIRAMPNTPALIREGVTGLVADSTLPMDLKEQVTTLFNACGLTFWVKDEAELDRLTAVAGSGRAYVFHMIEAMIEAAKRIGLAPEAAQQMVAQTFKGALGLAEREGVAFIASLRANVTSKAGVTEAALKVLMPALTPLFEEALRANLHRSHELRN